MMIKQVSPDSLVSASTYCRFFLRGEQSVGDIENKVAGGPSAVKNAGFVDASLWATPGYATVGGAAANYCTLAPAAHNFTLSGLTLIITARIKKAAAAFPAAEQYIAASYNPGSNTGGIILSCRTDGSTRCYVNATDGNSSSAATVVGKSLAGARDMRIGASLAGGSIDAYGIASFGAYQVPVDLASIDRKSVGDWCVRNPGKPIPDWVFA